MPRRARYGLLYGSGEWFLVMVLQYIQWSFEVSCTYYPTRLSHKTAIMFKATLRRLSEIIGKTKITDVKGPMRSKLDHCIEGVEKQVRWPTQPAPIRDRTDGEQYPKVKKIEIRRVGFRISTYIANPEQRL